MDSSSDFSFSLDLSTGSWDVSYDGELSPIYREDMSWESILSQMETFERFEE